MTAAVAATVASVMGVDVVPTQPLMEAGLDSLGAVELRNALAAKFAVELPATVTLDQPTIAALAQHIASLSVDAGQAAEVQSLSSWGSIAGTEVSTDQLDHCATRHYVSSSPTALAQRTQAPSHVTCAQKVPLPCTARSRTPSICCVSGFFCSTGPLLELVS